MIDKAIYSQIMKRLQIAIIGSAGNEEYSGKKPAQRAFDAAYEAGRYLAKKNAILICGGKGGIMESACRGAKEENGITVGVVSGNNRNTSNGYIDVEIVSGIINCAEESLIISMSDGIVAIGGGSGTLQELAVAYRLQKPVVAIRGINGWANSLANTYLDERKLMKIASAKDAKSAIDMIFKKISSKVVKKRNSSQF